MLVTFDMYSALVDIEAGLVPAVGVACRGVDATGFVRAWRAKQLEYAQLSNSLQRERIPFRVITRRSLDFVLARMKVALPEPARESLVAAWDRLPPWPEADAALNALAERGHTLAILSNGDESMLRALARGFTARFEHVFASDHAGHYKPHPSIYALPTGRLGIAPPEIVHVAGSGNDVLGAKLAGLKCAWSNRHGDPMLDPDVRADWEMKDLRGLGEVIETRDCPGFRLRGIPGQSP
ncbi:MAG TPA: haloacid dehalogenase type II [Usitatibacter sp.]|nr:haloacid dehalogenase type II [Usitatibacter sp.]